MASQQTQTSKDSVKQKKTSPTLSTQLYLDIAEIKDNVVVLKNGGLRAILQTNSINFNLKSEDEQNSIIYGYQNFLNSLEWLKENSQPDEVIIAGRSPWVYMLTERKTFTPPWVQNPQEVAQSLMDNKANYVITSPAVHSTQFLTPLIQQHPEMFEKIYEIGDCTIYRTIKRPLTES